MVAQGILATGHPAWPIHPVWDFAPLLISILLIVLFRAAHITLRPGVVVAAFVGGLMLDTLTDAVGISTATSIGVIAAMAALMALRGPRLG